MTTHDDPGTARGAVPVWDAERGRWVANGYGWDAEKERWLPLSPDAGSTASPKRTSRPASPRASSRLTVARPVAATAAATVVLAGLLFLGLGALGLGGGAPRVGTDPSTVVTTYLDAIARADASTALGQLAEVPGDRSFLTGEMLRASDERAPLADISVARAHPRAPDPLHLDVTATFTVGGTPATATFAVVRTAAGQPWRLGRGTLEIVVPAAADGLAVTVNGQAVVADTVVLFPGTYELASTNPSFTLRGGVVQTFADPGSASPAFADVRAELTETGVAAFRSAVADAVHACVAATSLVAGCGLDLPVRTSDGIRLVDGTVHRSLSGSTEAALAHLQPDGYTPAPLQVVADPLGEVEATADCEKDGRRYIGCTFDGLPRLGTPVVDFSRDPALVRWD